MKKNLIVLVMYFSAMSASSQIFTFTFPGTGSSNPCVTAGNAVTPANATVQPFSRTGVGCTLSSGYFSSTGWSQGLSVDVSQYIEVSITANAGYKLELTSVNFQIISSGTGPVTARVAHDGTGTFSTYYDFTVSSNPTPNWDFTDIFTGDAGTVKFRIYGWGATGSTGTLKITNFSVYGGVALVSGGGTSSQWTTTGNNISYALGNVGIGTATPDAQLHTTGTVKFSGITLNNSASRIITSDNLGNLSYSDPSSLINSNTWNIGGNTGSDPANNFLGTIDAQPLLFRTANTERLRIGNNGNVGIGTVNINDPAYKLFVETGIRTRRLKIDVPGTVWPDYVFSTDYKLPNLFDIERYIKANQHLPEIPSAEQVQQNGLDIGDNQSMLLKKIEEITLFLIAQNKSIEAMKKDIQAQNKKIKALQKQIK